MNRKMLLGLAIVLTTILVMGAAGAPGADASLMKAETFNGLTLRNIGPAFMSGRIADIVIDPRDQNTWYVAVGSGNVWKTTNAGTTWTPIFDHYGSYSIGCLTIDPGNPNVLWLGSGENVGGRHVGFGDGVYCSLDGGRTWRNMGLKKSEHIGRIVVDPRDSRVVYVAAQGPLWSGGGERGLYKTTDGGETWECVLSKGGEYTGVNDVVMDPRNPDILYAATHQRLRSVAALIDGGPGSGIYKTTDGGKTWQELKKGLPHEDMGRIGLAISPQHPDVIYATIELAQRRGGFYRSADRGESWEKRSDYLSGGTGPHYYQEIFASPHQFDRVYQMDVRIHVTDDGGKTFTEVSERFKHSDNHALAFRTTDPDFLVAGCDGGLYESWDRGKTWRFVANLPVTQFYKIALDNDTPFYNVYGGTQDNATQGGPSQTDNVNGIRNSDWFITIFADGYQPAVDPENPDIVYSQWQQGNLVRYDRKTGEVVYIQPQPGKGAPAERWNWDSPILISPHSASRLYFASQRVWRSDDRGDSWTPISGDLTRGEDRLKMPMMGRVWSVDALWDLMAMSNYATITSLAESPVQAGLLYAGTDDGLIQVSEDGGGTWRKIDTIPGVPPSSFVNDIKADLYDADTVYAAFDNHKTGDFSPYLVKSTDRGRTWTSITGDLPARHIVWRIVQDHVKPGLLFTGTEYGIFFTVNGGQQWIKLSGDVPVIPFRDLAIQKRENDLVGGSFGRGIFILDDYTPLRMASDELLKREVVLFPVRDARWYIPRRPLGSEDKAFQGDDFFVAPNPPFGAVFTYYLHDSLKTSRQLRREKEAKIEKEGGNTPYPGWKALRAESREESPAIVLTVKDTEGRVVRRLEGPISKGFHRLAWDLHYPSTRPQQGESSRSYGGGAGVLAAPGTYTVEVAKVVDGQATPLAEKQSFRVIPMVKGTLEGTPPAETTRFLQEVAELMRQVGGAGAAMGEAERRLGSMRKAIMRSTVADLSLDRDARILEQRLADLREELNGDSVKRRMSEPTPPSIMGRIRVIMMGTANSTYGPTETYRRNFTIATQEYQAAWDRLHTLIDVDIPALEKKLAAAGVPWTPGQEVPRPGKE